MILSGFKPGLSGGVTYTAGSQYNAVTVTPTMTPKPMPVATCAGTLLPSGQCVMSVSVNDPNGTAEELSTNAQDFGSTLENWAQGIKDSVVGLTPGGCPPDYEGTFPNCTQNSCSLANPMACVNWWAVGGIAALALLVLGGVAGVRARS